MRRTWIITGTAVVLLLGLAVTTDRIAAARASDRVADRLRCAAGLSETPAVDFEELPFLTQLARGTFGTVRARVPRVTVGRFTAAVDATAHDVRLPGTTPMSAASVVAEVTLPYADLGAAAAGEGSPDGAQPATYGSDDAGRLTIQTRVQLLGRPQEVTVYAVPTIVDGALRIEPEFVELPVLGLRVPASRLGDKARARTVDLPALPAGLVCRTVTATAAGLRLTITGTDVRPAAGASTGNCR
ncbi:DUF2993 domain-containing protein [Actinoplanes sp. NPDC051494]|uniref:DUF2993 domain-containing protein n=1 Tax=Actinoplanes sp. NPDC051494 TaxID=3363907 RepID=UPI003797A053